MPAFNSPTFFWWQPRGRKVGCSAVCPCSFRRSRSGFPCSFRCAVCWVPGGCRCLVGSTVLSWVCDPIGWPCSVLRCSDRLRGVLYSLTFCLLASVASFFLVCLRSVRSCPASWFVHPVGSVVLNPRVGSNVLPPNRVPSCQRTVLFRVRISLIQLY